MNEILTFISQQNGLPENIREILKELIINLSIVNEYEEKKQIKQEQEKKTQTLNVSTIEKEKLKLQNEIANKEKELRQLQNLLSAKQNTKK